MVLVRNPTKSVLYWSQKEKKFVNPFDIISSSIADASLEAHISNSKVGYYDLSNYSPVLPGVYPILPRTAWKLSENEISLQDPIELNIQNKPYGKHTIDTIAKNYFKRFKEIPIALELSGGLDSTLVLTTLRCAGFLPVLIGASWTRYEFRTERHIQKSLVNEYGLPSFVSEDEVFPFADMLRVPRHALPHGACLSWKAHHSYIDICHRLGIRAIVSGYGGDALLCNPLSETGSSYFFMPWQWERDWARDFIFSNAGINYLSAFSMRSIAEAILNIRRQENSAQQEDRYKILFRHLYKDSLPKTLSQYVYKASGSGLFVDGLQRAIPELLEIFDKAANIYTDKRITTSFLMDGLQSYPSMIGDDIREFEAAISFACWIYSNLKTKE